MELRNYETVFILTPVLSEDQIKDTVAKYVSLLKENGAKIVNEEQWGMKKLAYPIQKKNTGFFNLVEFEASADTVESIEVELRRDEKILRFLTVSLDKFAVAYNKKRKKGFPSKKQVA
jgi:small subunit ribosomal protein S6